MLKAILDGEREAVARGEISRSALAPCNYEFQVHGVDENGLAKVLLSPKRKERVLVSGAMFLRPTDGELVRVAGPPGQESVLLGQDASTSSAPTSGSKAP